MTAQDSELIEDVELSFKLLEFSIRAMCYAELGKIDSELFGQDLQLNLEEENVFYREGEFTDPANIIRASQMNVGAAFAATAISLDCALERHNEQEQSIETIRKLIQAIRNAFSHGIANPTWYVKPHRREILKLGCIRAPDVDLGTLNGKPFKYSDIGGFATWYRVKNLAMASLTVSAGVT